eukprot:395136-Prymnesium_polylepis.1
MGPPYHYANKTHPEEAVPHIHWAEWERGVKARLPKMIVYGKVSRVPLELRAHVAIAAPLTAVLAAPLTAVLSSHCHAIQPPPPQHTR